MHRYTTLSAPRLLVKTVGIFLLTAVLVTLTPGQSSYALRYDFEGHWAEQTVRYWVERGYLGMYDDGTFRPDDPVTRAEFVVMVNRLFGLEREADTSFTDVGPKDWYAPAVSIAAGAGYIAGEEDGTFNPNRPILREEAAAMLGRLMTPSGTEGDDGSPVVRDLRFASPYAHPFIRSLLDLEVLQGFGDHTFRPDQPLSRAEAVVLLERIGTWTDNRPVFYEDQVAVLMYHSVRSNDEYDHCIHEDVFARHVQMLQTSGFTVLSQEAFDAFLDDRSSVPDNAVLITFDDGYEDFYHLAYPRLKERGLPATMFMITSTIGDKDGWNPKIDALQMAEMAAQNISFQSHTHDGHRYIKDADGREDAFLTTRALLDNGTVETPNAYRDRIAQDLRQSKQVLDNLRSQDTRSLAAPYGRTAPDVSQVAREAGFSFLFTIRPGMANRQTDPHLIPRINAGYTSISANELKNTILRAAR